MRAAIRFAPLAIVVFACGSRSPLADDFAENAADAGPTTSTPGSGPTSRDAGTAIKDGGTTETDASITPRPGPLRPIAPMSTSTVTSHRPVFRWSLGSTGDDGARVEICGDRACTHVLTFFDAAGDSGSTPIALGRGVYYWRVRGMTKGVVGAEVSAAWEFFVGARSASVNSSWGSMLDLNEDGFADIALGTPNVTGLPYGAQLVGAVNVHLGSASGTSATTTTLISPTDNGPFSELGTSLSSAGDVNGDGFADLIAGAPGAGASPGAAYLFLGSANGPSASPTTIAGKVIHDYFGWSVAGAGDVNGDGYADVAIVAEGGGNSLPGAFLLLGSADGLTDPSPLTTSWYATGAASVGDTNGDGYGDLLLSSFTNNRDGGAIYLFLGGPGGLATSPIEIDNPGAAYGFFGFWASGAGDVNGDGLADVLVGSPGVTPTAYLYYGAAAGISESPVTLPSQGGPSDDLTYPYSPEFGANVSSAGDMNGDGFADIAVGTPATATVDLYFGSASGLSMTPTTVTLDPLGTAPEFGNRISSGDVNGDGFSDLLVGASGVGAIDAPGAAYVIYGSASGPVLASPQKMSDPGAVFSVCAGN